MSSQYITRIRLKDAAQTDFERLDFEMEKAMFARVVLTRVINEESPADMREYNCLGTVSLQEITAATYKAAGKTGKQYSFTVALPPFDSAASKC